MINSVWLNSNFFSNSYELNFKVLDYEQNQEEVEANVTVEVRPIKQMDLEKAVPVMIKGDPEDLLKTNYVSFYRWLF